MRWRATYAGRVVRRGYWHGSTDEPTSRAIALKAWALRAHELLRNVPHGYHATIGRDDLARRLMEDTDIHTEQQLGVWLDATLAPVAHVCARSGEPPLVALVVDKRSGYVGELYDEVLRATEQRPIEDPRARELHAARARQECYVWAGSAPADGGEPAALRGARQPAARSATPTKPSSPARAAVKAPPRPPKPAERPAALCPRCFLALPATGVCDTCD